MLSSEEVSIVGNLSCWPCDVMFCLVLLVLLVFLLLDHLDAVVFWLLWFLALKIFAVSIVHGSAFLLSSYIWVTVSESPAVQEDMLSNPIPEWMLNQLPAIHTWRAMFNRSREQTKGSKAQPKPQWVVEQALIRLYLTMSLG